MVIVRHALQLQTPTTTLSRINDINKNFFFIIVEFVNTVKQYIEVCHAGYVGEDTSLRVFGYSALMDTDAFAVWNFANERQEFLELGRPGTFERVSAGRDDVVRVLEGWCATLPLLEGEDKGSRHCFARRAISL